MSFEAKYGGTCGECGDRIHVGDLAKYGGDVIMHADCEDSVKPERKADVCTECWLTRPCDCEAHA